MANFRLMTDEDFPGFFKISDFVIMLDSFLEEPML